MSQLLAGKTALILGVANRWSLAYAIAQAFTREGAKLILTYQGDRQKPTVEELAADLKAHQTLPCDITKDGDIEQLTNELKNQGTVLNSVVHSIAFGDLSRPLVETSRDGFAPGFGYQRLFAGGRRPCNRAFHAAQGPGGRPFLL